MKHHLFDDLFDLKIAQSVQLHFGCLSILQWFLSCLCREALQSLTSKLKREKIKLDLENEIKIVLIIKKNHSSCVYFISVVDNIFVLVSCYRVLSKQRDQYERDECYLKRLDKEYGRDDGEDERAQPHADLGITKTETLAEDEEYAYDSQYKSV
jgi:hypothetical protein